MKIPWEAGKGRWVRKDEFETKIMTTMILDPIELRQKTLISTNILSDDTPDYKTQTNNYSDWRSWNLHWQHLLVHQDLINQLNTFILIDDERDIAEFLVVASTTWVISVVVSQIFIWWHGVTRALHWWSYCRKNATCNPWIRTFRSGRTWFTRMLLLQLKHKTPTESVELMMKTNLMPLQKSITRN
jgi:RNA polymerase sigma-54 factor